MEPRVPARPSYIALANTMLVLVVIAVGAKFLKRFEVHGRVNELAESGAAYLQTARYDLIEWREWNDSTLAEAAKNNKPMLIDVGVFWSRYAALMSEQIYTDVDIIQYINTHFTCVRVDAEQRPDVAACLREESLVLGGVRDWPIVAIAAPNAQIFAVTTYSQVHPRDDFLRFLQDSRVMWQDAKEDQIRRAATLLDDVKADLDAVERTAASPSAEVIEAMARAIATRFDSTNGGFIEEGTTVKRTEAPTLYFLLDRISTDPAAKEMLRTTLDALRDGSLNDPVSGAFHLESLDRTWSDPRFPKLLSDNTQLMDIFARAGRLLSDPSYLEIANIIGQHILYHFVADSGDQMFAARRGSRVATEPGAFYLWSRAQVQAACSPDQATAIRLRFGMDRKGSVAWDPGLHVLMPRMSYDDVARRLRTTADEAKNLILDGLERMRNDPSRMELRPPVDLAVYSDINGMGAFALASVAEVLQNRDYLTTARRVVDRLMDLRSESDNLIPHGEGFDQGLLADQAWPARAAVAVYKSTKEQKYLAFAQSVLRRIERNFEDINGTWGLWQRSQYRHWADADRRARLEGRAVSRPFVSKGLFAIKPISDGIAVSDNANVALLALEVYDLTKEKAALNLARRTVSAFAASVQKGLPGRIGLGVAMQRYVKVAQ